MTLPPRRTAAEALASLARIQRKNDMLAAGMAAVNKMAEQDELWGPSDHPDGTNESGDMDRALDARLMTDSQKALLGDVTWRTVLEEEVAKAFASRTPAELRERLVDIMGVAGSWVMRLDDRAAGRPR